MINNVLDYLEKNEQRCPEKTALADTCVSITYAQYADYARRIGTGIARAIKQTNMPVAVLIDRNVRSIYTFLGVVYSGNFYVPIDATMPIERVQLILDTLQPMAILDARDVCDGSFGAVSVDEYLDVSPDRLLLSKIRDNMIDIDPLYTIFTSGSTGVPKGVTVAHRSVIDLLEAFEEAFNFTESTVWGNQAPFDFDVSVKDIYNALYVGGTVQIIPKKLFMSPVMLLEYIDEHNIDTLIWAVSALRIVSDFKALDKYTPKCLNNVMFSGEVMPVKSLNYWMENIENVRYVNLYGPTEITCNCTYYVIDRHFSPEEKIPAGKPFKNTRVYLRDESGHIIRPENADVIGEIAVSGTCVACGYYNNEQKTSEAFVKDIGVSAYPGIMYATGDLGYYDNDGNIVFASRKDSQIKHMGHRIELGEIETALNAIEDVTVACCVFDEEKGKIVCFYQAQQECKKQIVDGLGKKLPKYMWPNIYVHYEQLPFNKNGKIDRVKLKKDYIENR